MNRDDKEIMLELECHRFQIENSYKDFEGLMLRQKDGEEINSYELQFRAKVWLSFLSVLFEKIKKNSEFKTSLNRLDQSDILEAFSSVTTENMNLIFSVKKTTFTSGETIEEDHVKKFCSDVEKIKNIAEASRVLFL